MARARVMRRNDQSKMEEVDVKPQIMNAEMAKLIGTESAPTTLEVERGAIRRYAQAIEDQNPLYNDVEYAKKSKYGEMICPPGFFGWPVKPRNQTQAFMLNQTIMKESRRSISFDNGGELELILPIRAGDILTSITKIADIYEEVGRSGNRFLLAIRETTYVNQNGDIVAKSRARSIYP